jgi:hypothetical protein
LDTNNESLQLTGIVDKESISLNVQDVMTWTGSIKDKILTLAMPQNDGTLKSYVFNPASIEDYNASFNLLKGRITDENKRSADEILQKQADKAQSDKLAAENNAVIDYNQRLAQDISILSNSILKGTDLKDYDEIMISYDTHWKNMLSNHQVQITHATKNPLTSDDIYDASNDLYAMSNDLYNISNDKYAFDNVTRSINEYTSGLQEGIGHIEAVWENLQKADANNTSGPTAPAYNLEDITVILKGAHAEIDKTNLALKDRSSKALKYEKDADLLYKAADKYQNGLKSND